MSYVLRLHAATTTLDIMTAIRHIHARRVALLFPLGEQITFADPASLQALRAYCDGLDKEIAVVGGNETLRAAAVTAGFTAALGLDDWQTDPVLPAISSRPRGYRRRHFGHRQEPQWQAGAIYLISSGDSLNESSEDDWDDEVPHYIETLLDHEGFFHRLDNQTGSERTAFPRITRPLAELTEAEALRQSDESHEERITLAIRDTAGLPPAGKTQYSNI